MRRRLDSRHPYGSITIHGINNIRNSRWLHSDPVRMSLVATPELARMSVSLPHRLLVRLDAMVGERGLHNRSQMISELIRHAIAEHSEARTNSVLAGTVTLIYRAENGRVRQALAQTQSQYIKEVISSQHVLLEEDQSLEVLLVQGPARRLQALCDDLRRVRGIQQIKLVTTTALLPPLHSHGAIDAASRSSRSK